MPARHRDRAREAVAPGVAVPRSRAHQAAGALYQIYAAPGEVTDIALQEGETLVGSGLVAAGDTARWIIGDAISGDTISGDTISGADATRRVHILVKPTRPALRREREGQER